jgi:hypothetical protein
LFARVLLVRSIEMDGTGAVRRRTAAGPRVAFFRLQSSVLLADVGGELRILRATSREADISLTIFSLLGFAWIGIASNRRC